MRTYAYKLKPTAAQKKRIDEWVGVCRYVYNMSLEIRIASRKSLVKMPTAYDLMRQLKGIRSAYDWVQDVPVQCLEDAIKRLDMAYKRFFKGAGFPKFRGKKNFASISFRQSLSIQKGKIRLAKIGWVNFFEDRLPKGNIKGAIIKIKNGNYYVIVNTDYTPSFVGPNSENQAIGIDMGLAHFAVDSEGRFVSNPKHFSKHERRLRIENRSLARKKKGSKSWIKQVKRLSLLHHKIANVRKDFLHKESTIIAANYNRVYLENLNISGMAKNRRLSKSISDAGWGMFKTMLSYKTTVVLINPKHTSQQCFQCGHIDSENRKTQSDFICMSCGHSDNADVNAAKNIKSQGMTLVRQRNAVA